MNTHTVYRVDSAGWLAGELTVSHTELPPNTTHVPPPAHGEGERPRWVRGRWHVLPAPSEISQEAPAVMSHQVSARSLRQLFTFDERVKIDNGGESKSLSPEHQAALRTLQNDLSHAPDAKLHDTDVVRIVNLLRSCGILSADRAAQVLTGRSPA